MGVDGCPLIWALCAACCLAEGGETAPPSEPQIGLLIPYFQKPSTTYGFKPAMTLFIEVKLS